jgi:hypothetical protein
MGTDAVAFEEDFYSILCEPDINLAFDIFKRDRIVPAINADVIIVLHCSDFPYGKLEWVSRQWLQEQPFFFKRGRPAAIFFLKRFVVERVKPFVNYDIKFFKR